MTIDDFRAGMNGFWERVSHEGLEFKDSYLPLKRLGELYGRFDDAERALADEVLREWVVADEEDKRFAAMSIIDDFRLIDAVPALTTLVQRLEGSDDPGAPFEREKANRLIRELTQPEESQRE